MAVIKNTEQYLAYQRYLTEAKRRKELTPEALKQRLLSEFSPKLHFLYESHRYKGAYSGRYAGKSWAFGDALLWHGFARPLRIMCARETMKSIADSVHTLLKKQIKRLGLESHYDVLTTGIRGKNGTEIFYAGLHNNTESIKSVEACDIVWVEEAQSTSKDSWDTLIPTIRKEGSEIWLTWNPDTDQDDTHQRFIVSPPTGAQIVRISWRDNKFVNAMMLKEMKDQLNKNQEDYDHIYEGALRSTVQDAVYKAQIVAAEQNSQFTRVPYDARKVVDVAFDLGWGDLVSMWFYQAFPFETRIIDYYENRHEGMDHYLQILQGRGYVYGKLIMPWDGGAKHISSGKSAADIAKAKGFKVEVLRQGLVADRIEALRTLFPQLYFDATNCDAGIQHLRRYQWGPPAANGKIAREPLHDIHSHSADALGYMAVGLKTVSAGKPPRTQITRQSFGGSMSWAR